MLLLNRLGLCQQGADLARVAHEWAMALQFERCKSGAEPTGRLDIVRLQSAKDVSGAVAVATARRIGHGPRPKRRNPVNASRRQKKRTFTAECDYDFRGSEVRDCSRGAFRIILPGQNSRFREVRLQYVDVNQAFPLVTPVDQVDLSVIDPSEKALDVQENATASPRYRLQEPDRHFAVGERAEMKNLGPKPPKIA